MRRVVINGQSYAVGLDWFPLKEDMKRAELVLEAEGYDEKCDLSVVLEKQYAPGPFKEQVVEESPLSGRNACPEQVP